MVGGAVIAAAVVTAATVVAIAAVATTAAVGAEIENNICNINTNILIE